jgi:hypothetical protein
MVWNVASSAHIAPNPGDLRADEHRADANARGAEAKAGSA